MAEAANPNPRSPVAPLAKGPPAGPTWRRVLVPLVLVAGIGAWQYFGSRTQPAPSISYTSFFALVDSGKVESVTVQGSSIAGKLKAEEKVEGHAIKSFETLLPSMEDHELLPLLRKKEVRVEARSTESSGLITVLVSFLPWVLILGVWFWISRRAQRSLAAGPGGMLAARSHRIEPANTAVTFEDVAGLKAAKHDLAEIVEFLKEPERFRRLGAKVPRGVLLVGPPGTGKTLLARAVAGEANVPFFSISGSEFIELFVGMGASRVRDLFAEARKVSPAIVFIDEIDAVGRSRGTGLGGGHDEREQTLNQLLSEMDGFSRNDLTIVLAATNRPDVLDSALLRPGRFDRRVVVDRPERAARESILRVHTRGKPIAPDVELLAIAGTTPGFSGADLANLVNEAALGATRRGADAIASSDFAEAYDKIVLGDPRETKLDPEEKRRVAVHESGHALLAHLTPHAEPVERVSIIPRGMALGATQQTPGMDRHLLTRSELGARLCVLMGGCAAEATLLGDISTGAEHDLRKATEIATSMVAHYGMSDRVGPTFHEHKVEHAFLGQRLATEGGTSDATVRVIEEETRRLLDEALASAKATIENHRPEMDRLVAAVLEHESLDRDELVRLLA